MKSISDYLDIDYLKWKNKNYIWTKGKEGFYSRAFGEFIEDVWALSKILLRDGYKNKNIMIYSENSYEWMVLDIAIMGYVGVSVPIDHGWTSYEIINILKNIDIAIVFYSNSKRQQIEEVKNKYLGIKYICIQENITSLIEQGRKIESIQLNGKNHIEETSKILFTSGTTDIPKAIPLSQANMFNNWETLYKRTPMTQKDKSYIFLPLHHVYSGVANFLYTIISGMEIYLCSDMKLMLEEMMEIHPTVVCTVPLIIERVYAVIDDNILDMLRKIRFLYCGGSFTEYKLKKYFIDNEVNLLEAYGTTETSSVIALDYLEDENIQSNGVVFENLQVKLIDQDENGIGELLVKGGSVSRDYYDEEGYYHTGDLAKLDADGHLYLQGRKRRCIITANGKNVFPDEIESMLLKHNDEIKKVRVYEEDGYITLSIFSNLDEEEVKSYVEYINQRLAKYEQIRKVYINKDILGNRIK